MKTTLIEALEEARAKFHGLAAAVKGHIDGTSTLDMNSIHELLQEGNKNASTALKEAGKWEDGEWTPRPLKNPIYISLVDDRVGKVAETIDVNDQGNVFVDLDDLGNILGIEVLKDCKLEEE